MIKVEFMIRITDRLSLCLVLGLFLGFRPRLKLFLGFQLMLILVSEIFKLVIKNTIKDLGYGYG